MRRLILRLCMRQICWWAYLAARVARGTEWQDVCHKRMETL